MHMIIVAVFSEAPKMPKYKDVLEECAGIRNAHDWRVERAVRAVDMRKERFDWEQRVIVEVEDPEALEGDGGRRDERLSSGSEENESEEEEVPNKEVAPVTVNNDEDDEFNVEGALFNTSPTADYGLLPSPASSIIASRQYRFPRDLLDVCINVNANLLVDASQLLGLSSLLGALNLVQDLDLYLDTKDQLSALIGLLGRDTVGALITALINPLRMLSNAPFLNTPTTPATCPIPVIMLATFHMSTKALGGSSLADEKVQGNYDFGSSTGLLQIWRDCMRYLRSAECQSGGGCMAPHPFFEAEPVRVASGKDYLTIANTKSTSCSSYLCVVNNCKEGWVPTPQKDSQCRRVENDQSQEAISVCSRGYKL
ncbi:hypothetical protein CVT25_007533 [Psilocybe cyanescens]|uniref:Protein CPL1-like domain-containing protein n=1 Tax=Psilocybe cyanescens TaxID=93625 RepID=A0A409XGG0_PSICY|nr:hypothetical protein CVT25_007533 [Psilocybe cyanescens]